VLANLAGKTFEVQAGDGSRWTTMDVFQSRSQAIKLADEILESGKHAAVQVVADSERTGTEIVYESSRDDGTDKRITIVPVSEAPLCQGADDFYELPARRVISRVLRKYLEEHARTALELLFDASHQNWLERQGQLMSNAIQQVGGVQARAYGGDPRQRIDAIYDAVERINETAKSLIDAEEGYDILQTKGLEALVQSVTGVKLKKERNLYIRYAIARYLGKGGDWNAKIALLLELTAERLSDGAVRYIDEVLAEILDYPRAVLELLGGQSDAATANRVLVHLSGGKFSPPRNPISCIVEFNTAMRQHKLPLTRIALLDQIAVYLSGTRPLTKEGREAERKAFTILIRDLTDVSGLKGGPRMCTAVVNRARIALADGQYDLTYPDALARIISLLPHRAARIGFLIELAQGSLSEEHTMVVFSFLAQNVEQLTSLSALVPDNSPQALVDAALSGLRDRLSAGDLPEDWRDKLTGAFEDMMAKPVRAAAKKENTFSLEDDRLDTMSGEKPTRKTFKEGDILFEEGDAGTEAYLIVTGEVQIFRKNGNEEQTIANVGRGEIIGEMSLIDNQPRMASARVLEPASLVVISQDSLAQRLSRLGDKDRVLRRLLDVLVKRLRGEGRTAP